MRKCDGQISEMNKIEVFPFSFTGGSQYNYKQTQDDVRHFERHAIKKLLKITDFLEQG